MATTGQIRRSDEYPYPIQELGGIGIHVYDRVEAGLLDDGFTQQEADMLMQINMDQVVEQARLERKEAIQREQRGKRKSPHK